MINSEGHKGRKEEGAGTSFAFFSLHALDPDLVPHRTNLRFDPFPRLVQEATGAQAAHAGQLLAGASPPTLRFRIRNRHAWLSLADRRIEDPVDLRAENAAAD
jgi:hypothetical protein